MKCITLIKKIYLFINRKYYTSSSNLLIKKLRKSGVKIGDGCIFRYPKTVIIDITRPYLITIGNNVDMNINFKIYTHDWASHVFIAKYGQMINSSGCVNIGNNVYFGADCTILKGVNIGDNSIIGAGSIITKSIPPNSVAAGNPCKVICSVDEYFKKRLKLAPLEAIELVNKFYERYGKWPKINDLREEYIYFNKGNILSKFSSYSDFLNWCKDYKKEK